MPFETWTSCSDDAEGLARALEAHLNEFAESVISVAYAVTDIHYVLAVYEPVDATSTGAGEAAVSVAEQIIDGTHT